jgi:serine/threonine protein kinase
MFWGTLDYAAPEVIRFGASAYTPASDWWAVGVLMYEMLYGAAPFAADSEEDTMAAICSGEVFLPDGPVQVGARLGAVCACRPLLLFMGHLHGVGRCSCWVCTPDSHTCQLVCHDC